MEADTSENNDDEPVVEVETSRSRKRRSDAALTTAPQKRARSRGSLDLSERHSVSSPALSYTSVADGPKPPGLPSVTYNFINNKLVMSKTRTWNLVHDPATQKLLTRVPDATLSEIQNAVSAAQDAQPAWASLSLKKRRVLLYTLLDVLRNRSAEIAVCICKEVGKTMSDAHAEVTRGLDAIETACSIGNEMYGIHLADDSAESHTVHEPLGVCATITPFNFPLMTPLWSIPYALITGNTVVLKPSDKTPTAVMLLADCIVKSGFPPGTFNVIHGGASAVDKLLAQPAVKAVSFVGSDDAGERIVEHARATKKRVQAECGGKNHGVILEDANRMQTLYAIAGSAFGAAGQRCMALSVAVFVGETRAWLDDLVDIANSLSVGCSSEPGVEIGPLITKAAKENVEGIIKRAVDEGATMLLDGRSPDVPDYPEGNFIGPTILADVQPFMECYQKEIFGPVLCCMTVDTVEEAIEIVNENRFGNGCSIFTGNPATAQAFQKAVNVGQIGVNVPVLAPYGILTRTANKDSFIGDFSFANQTYWPFYTTTKTITSRWR